MATEQAEMLFAWFHFCLQNPMLEGDPQQTVMISNNFRWNFEELPDGTRKVKHVHVIVTGGEVGSSSLTDQELLFKEVTVEQIPE